MIYGSVCSGIEAATCAWRPLGFHAAWFAEIEKFCCAVLQTHYPEVPNLGDFTTIKESRPLDVLVGGTPCPSFSLAGDRKGLDDPRGHLTLEFLGLAGRIGPRWLVWENVPGVLSNDKGRAFGTILGRLAKLGYGFAYRILDAQFFRVAQHRRRVFLVGYLGDWRPPAAVLFERHSLSGYPAPSREARQEVARSLGSCAKGGFRTTDLDNNGAYIPCVSPAIKSRDYKGPSSDGDGDGAAIVTCNLQQITSKTNRSVVKETPPTLSSQSRVVVFTERTRSNGRNLESNGDCAYALTNPGEGGRTQSRMLMDAEQFVRRLTPRECERLQGFIDDYTLVKYRKRMVADGPRYRAIGNSMAVPVMRWIGERIQQVEEILQNPRARRP